MPRKAVSIVALLGLACVSCAPAPGEDPIRQIQQRAAEHGRSPVCRWGTDAGSYASWPNHTNRLIPVYTYGTRGAQPGIDLDGYSGSASVYRDADRLRELYGTVPRGTLAPDAEYLDQTELATLQRAALAAGRRHIVVFIFDGMDWDTTRAAAIARAGEVRYEHGRGSGLHFQDYGASGTSQFGFLVTAPAHERARGDADTQRVVEKERGRLGGYDPLLGGPDPWTPGSDPEYIAGGEPSHAIADSASSATAVFAGVKTFVGAINVDLDGGRLSTVAHEAQARGFAVGLVTSVPLSHATPASAYAHNVTRYDYQDITRDLLGLPSVSHPETALPGMDVVIGCGHGVEVVQDERQGSNFVPGNRYVTERDLELADASNGGRYVVARRQPGLRGVEGLNATADEAARTGRRLLGLYGVVHSGGHLPYRTADRDYRPVSDITTRAEEYSAADLYENPTLAEMTSAALSVVGRGDRGFWLLVEAGDVDWANHDANVDNSIGAVHAGDDAVRIVTEWIEAHSGWDEALLIVTSDHGHYFVLDDPHALLGGRR